MPKSNRTIGAWLSGLQSVDDVSVWGSGFSSSVTPSLWSGGNEEFDRQTVVGGWTPVVHSVDNQRSDRKPVYLPNNISDEYDRNAYWLFGDRLADKSDWVNLSATQNRVTIIEIVNVGSVLTVGRGAYYYVKCNRGVIAVKGQARVIVQVNKGLVCIDNFDNAVAINVDCGKLLRRDVCNPALVCATCMDWTSLCGHNDNVVLFDDVVTSRNFDFFNNWYY